MNQRKKKAYCHIIACVNNRGTFDKNEVMFRVPSNQNRTQWIEAIEKVQPFRQEKTNFNVCIRHFINSDVEKRGDKFTLFPNAIPSVFENYFIEIISNEIIDESVTGATCCPQCPCLLEKIKKLEYQILLMKTKHSISIGKIEQKNDDLKRKNLEKTKQLKSSEKEKTKLKYYLDDLRSQNFISDAERDFLNVNIFMFIIAIHTFIFIFLPNFSTQTFFLWSYRYLR